MAELPVTPTDDDAEVFVTRLARALHAYGSPAHRLEDAMTAVAESLGLEAGFFAMPTAVFASLGRGAHRRAVLERVQPGEHDLEKLVRVDAVASAVIRGEVDAATATHQLDAIVAAKPRYGPVVVALAFAVASGGAARFFGGHPVDLAVAAAAGLLIGLLALASGRSRTLPRVFEAVAALLASSVAAVAASFFGASAFIVTLSALIVLVPGLTLTVAMAELASQHLASGTARLTGAGMVFLMIGFGVALGSRVAELLPAAPPPSAIPLPPWTEVAAVLAVPLALVVLFRAHPRDSGWIVAAGALGFYGARLGGLVVGPELGTFVGGALVGSAGNLFSRLFDKPSAVATVPGIMLLVPGSIGFRSLFSLMERNVLSGVEAAFTTTVVASALVAGLLVSSILVPPRKAL